MRRTLLAFSLMCAWPVWAADRLPVVASFSILGDISAQLGGERVDVQTLVGPNQDAHVYQPAPQDLKKLAAAKLFVVNGLGFEGWMTRMSKAAGYRGQTVQASQGVKALSAQDEDAHDHDHGHGKQDPHAWQNPQNVLIYAKNISDAFIRLDPEGKAYYTQRFSAYSQSLKNLDHWAAQGFAAIPAAQRKFITSHDAFGYLGARYQIKVLSPQGISTEAEASAKGVVSLVRQIRREKIRSVFIENMTDSRLIAQIARESGASMGEKLYSDALSKSDAPAATYVDMMRHNISAILQSMKE